MSKKELPLLHFNNIAWRPFHLGENTLLLQAPADVVIDTIHQSAAIATGSLGGLLLDIVPSYDSIALFHDGDYMALLSKLSSDHGVSESHGLIRKDQVLPICYELGPDVEDVAKHAGVSKEEVINTHLGGTYRVILIGFTPGFIYMDGLDPKLACPRRKNPRKQIESGAVGIGGEQTGIYSLNSPGGWNIIGRTPFKLFDPDKQPPLEVEPGTIVSFSRISKKEFEQWGS